MEYDEHRLSIANEIGLRFLGINSLTTTAAPVTTLISPSSSSPRYGKSEVSAHRSNVTGGRSSHRSSRKSVQNSAPPLASYETEICNDITTANTLSASTGNAVSNSHSNYSCSSGSDNLAVVGSGNGQHRHCKQHFEHQNGDEHIDGNAGDCGGVEPVAVLRCSNGGRREADESNGGGGGDNYYQMGIRIRAHSREVECSNEGELVLDILNNDLIARVREKIKGGNKELFESCVTAVKAFLAGEPFREFQTSMYFHR